MTIRLDRMQRVHTLIRFTLPLTSARTVWMLASKRRGVTLWAWLTLRPTAGPFPHTSQRLAMVINEGNGDNENEEPESYHYPGTIRPDPGTRLASPPPAGGGTRNMRLSS